MKPKTHEILERAAGRCTEEGECAEVCSHLKTLGDVCPGGIARALLNGPVEDRVRDFILKCSVCGLCSESCDHDVDLRNVVRAAREQFIEDGTMDPEEYRYLWIDHDWNVITAFRDTYQINEQYEDLLKESCEVLFFPGCALANEGPELVRYAADWLAGAGHEVGLSPLCCGAPLVEMGLTGRAQRYTEKLWKRIREIGARRIVTACPNCQVRLEHTGAGEEIEVVSLFELLAEAGAKARVIGNGRITVHDSCPSRQGDLGQHVRALLGDYEIVEMKHHGKRTLCCGSGGVVSQIDPEICGERARVRLEEVEETQADACITYCMACSHRLAGEPGGENIRYVLELVFDQLLDHGRYYEMIEAMWEGEWGEYNRDRVENSKELEL